VADWDDVRRFALALPETTEQKSRGTLSWRVNNKLFVWERPLRAADLEALGDLAPLGAVAGVRVGDLGEKEALLHEDPAIFFTTPHFEGYPSVLVRLNDIAPGQLQPLVIDAWLCRAPTRLVKTYLQASATES
jgi:hypothetical protein